MMTAHRGPAASHLMTEGMWDHKVSAAIAVNIYRNPNAQTPSQTLVVSRHVFAPQTFDFPRILTHARLRVIIQAHKKNKPKKKKRREAKDRLGKVVVGAFSAETGRLEASSQASLFTRRCDDTHDCVRYKCSEL